jgi:transposase
LANVLEPQEVAHLRDLRAEGASIGEISRRTGHSKSTVHRYVAEQGMPLAADSVTSRLGLSAWRTL